MPDRDGEGFLTRWSRLKRGQGDETQRPQPTLEAPGTAAPEIAGAGSGPDAAEVAARQDEPPAIRIEDLPKIDDLTADSDFSVFLQRGVPEELKRLALRRAWTLDPAIRDFVEMAENQYDFNAGTVPGFGALDSKTDIGQLLAQATGQWPLRQNDADDSLVNVAAPDAAPDDAADSPGEHAPERVASAVADAGEPAEPPENSVQKSAPVLRRRHGGALPG